MKLTDNRDRELRAIDIGVGGEDARLDIETVSELRKRGTDLFSDLSGIVLLASAFRRGHSLGGGPAELIGEIIEPHRGEGLV
ncbi:MAG: hypothetical protein JJT96_07815 [Opitutales bacterium]|nr:hypothetical protein [Opitutales bacterium]